ncbi:MAG: FHA domain-containing protein, partial [Myxococcota bacterium]|nr:FHA domain-containing protein [Myxococcota bacterium]
EAISRHHAKIVLHNGSAWVQDAGSRNGVFVDDERVTRPKNLSPGKIVQVGEQAFTIEAMMTPPDESTVSTIVQPSKVPVWVVGLVVGVAVGLLLAILFL